MTQLIQDANSFATRRTDAVNDGTYDIYIEIDCDCEELVDAVGLDYERTEEDSTQNEVCLTLDKYEWADFAEDVDFNFANEQLLGALLLNEELGEYVTKVTIYKPSGDIVSFY